MNITIEKATEKDIDFLVEAIIAAEKSGTNTLSYAMLFELDEETVRSKLREMLMEDITGQELCISGFLIARAEAERAGAICSWVEGEEGSSALLKASVLSFGFGKEIFKRVLEKASLLEPLNINREEGALQLESVYVVEKFRGMGIVKALLDAHINKQRARNAGLVKAQIILAKDNSNAWKAYVKAGFNPVLEKYQENMDILKYLPSQTKILMEKDLNT